MLENLRLPLVEELWDRRDRRDVAVQRWSEDNGETSAEWETVVQAEEAERLRRSTLADRTIPDFTAGFMAGRSWSSLGIHVPERSKLCEKCTELAGMIKELGWSDGDREGMPREMKELRESECDVCAALGKFLNFTSFSNQTFQVVVSPPWLNFQSEWGEYGFFTAGRLRLYVEPSSEAALFGHSVGIPVPLNPEADSYFELLRAWIKDCDVHHRNCTAFLSELSELPTRVIDVRDPATLRLYCSPPGSRERYTALSHCWGYAPTFKTTKNEVAQLCSGFNLKQLPQTFQDAVDVTRRLDIPFLWIDSLCIIQDDTDDWNKESRLMEKVFSGAYCTIAASSAADSTQGFLSRSPPDTHGLIRLADPAASSSSKSFIIYAGSFTEAFTEDVENGILNTRAWVYQERALSRRILHFTSNQTYWECGSVIRSECQVDLTRDLNWLGDSNFPFAASRLHPDIASSMFEEIYSTYSCLNLTRIEDRPIAIRGLEARLSRFYRTKGYYGVFEKFLVRSLLWRKRSWTLKRIDFTKGQGVPSWSCMGYEGRIQYGDEKDWFKGVDWKVGDGVKLVLEKSRLVAPLAGMFGAKGCHFDFGPVVGPISGASLRDSNGLTVGWLSFDRNDWGSLLDEKRLGCIILGACERDKWHKYAGLKNEIEGSRACFVLLVTAVDSMLGFKTVYQREGVGVITMGLFKEEDSQGQVHVI